METNEQPLKALSVLLMSLFNEKEDLNIFLEHQNINGKDILNNLVSPTSLANHTMNIVKSLEQRGDINLSFFQSLAMARPNRKTDIAKVAALWNAWVFEKVSHPGALFVPRQKLYEQAMHLLSKNTSTPRILSLVGQPFYGKTSLSKHIAHKIAEKEGLNPIWVPAGSDQFGSGDPWGNSILSLLTDQINGTKRNEYDMAAHKEDIVLSHRDLRRVTVESIENHPKSLFLIDGIEQKQNIRNVVDMSYLFPDKYFIVTSRNKIWMSMIGSHRVLEVGGLEWEQAEDLRRLNLGDGINYTISDKVYRDLWQHLNGNPAALQCVLELGQKIDFGLDSIDKKATPASVVVSRMKDSILRPLPPNSRLLLDILLRYPPGLEKGAWSYVSGLPDSEIDSALEALFESYLLDPSKKNRNNVVFRPSSLLRGIELLSSTTTRLSCRLLEKEKALLIKYAEAAPVGHSNLVAVFTPNYEVSVFPHGSTIIDFAFSVHSHVGFLCERAWANGKPTPLSEPLRSGMIIRIGMGKKSIISKSWLQWSRTPRAIKAIDSALSNVNTTSHRFISKGDIKSRKGNISSAIDNYKAAEDRFEHDIKLKSKIWNRIGNCKRLLGDYNGAKEAHQNALIVPESAPYALAGLGAVEYAHKNFLASLNYYKEAVRINPIYVNARLGFLRAMLHEPTTQAHQLEHEIDIFKAYLCGIPRSIQGNYWYIATQSSLINDLNVEEVRDRLEKSLHAFARFTPLNRLHRRRFHVNGNSHYYRYAIALACAGSANSKIALDKAIQRCSAKGLLFEMQNELDFARRFTHRLSEMLKGRVNNPDVEGHLNDLAVRVAKQLRFS